MDREIVIFLESIQTKLVPFFFLIFSTKTKKATPQGSTKDSHFTYTRLCWCKTVPTSTRRFESSITEINHDKLEDLRPQATESIAGDATNTWGSPSPLKSNQSAKYQQCREHCQNTSLLDSSVERSFTESHVTNKEPQMQPLRLRARASEGQHDKKRTQAKGQHFNS